MVVAQIGTVQATGKGNRQTKYEILSVEWQGVDGQTNLIFTESVRDVGAEPELPNMARVAIGLDRVSAHEALHRFLGWDGTHVTADQGIMDGTTLMTASDISLTDEPIRVIQKTNDPR